MLVLAAAACHHETASPPSNQVVPPPSASVAADALAFVPVDADIVLGVDVAALRKSALWTEYQPMLTSLTGPLLASVQKTCGFDPIQAIQSVTLGVLSKDTANTVLVVRGLDHDRTIACLQAQVVPDVTVAVDHDIVSLTHSAGHDLLAFADRTTMVLQGSRDGSPDGLRALLKSGAPLRSSPVFLDMFGHLEPGATAWLVVNGNAAMFDQLGAMGNRPRAIYGTLRLAAGLGAKIHFRMTTPEQATQLAATAQGQTQQVAAMVDRIEATSQGEVMTVSVEMSLDKLRSLISMIAMLAGGAKAPPPPPPPPSP